jgi:hypothetical protein
MNMSAWAIRLLLGATTPQTWDAFHAPALRRTGIHDNPRLFFFMLSMASRAPTSAMYSDDDDDDLGRYDPESSPDPLAGSIAVDRPKPNPRRKPARSSKEPLVTSSPSKTNRRPSVAEQVLDQFSSERRRESVAYQSYSRGRARKRRQHGITNSQACDAHEDDYCPAQRP